MKRIISYLLVAAMLLIVMPFAMSGCSDGTDESSIEGAPNESGEPEESGTTEDGDDMTVIKNDPNYTNVALNKPYTKCDAHADYPDTNNAILTDGSVAAKDAKYSDDAFMAFNKGQEFYKQNSYAEVTVDLGEVYYLDKFVAHLGSKYFSSVGIAAPEFVRVYLSNDGKEWYKAGITVHKDTDATNTVASTLEFEGAYTARYVQYRFIGGVSNWMFVSELEAYGIKADEAKPYPETQKALNYLFIGNSSTYFFNVPDKLALIAESVGIELNVTYFQTGGAYLSQFADPSDTARGFLLRSTLAQNKYDVIVLQDNSNADYDDSKAAMDKLVPVLKKAQPDAELMLYERYSSNTDPNQRPISGKRLHNAYTQLAKDFDIEKNAHVVDAFLLCYEKYPNIVLHHTDNSHHSDIGAYLIASVMAIEYLGINLDEVSYTGGNDDATVAALKEIAKLACETGYVFK
jgi:hypothetical protein